MSDSDLDARAAYTAGLRALADALDANTELPLPYHGSSVGLLVILNTEQDQRAALRHYAHAFDGAVRKGYRDFDFDLHGTFRGLKVQVIADRDQVCERVVTGTREVTREIPDPEALAAVPTVTVTETIEDVTWECRPLLAEAPAAVSA